MLCSFSCSRSMSRWPRLSLMASCSLIALAIAWYAPKPALAEEGEQEAKSQETESKAAPTTKKETPEKEGAAAVPPEAKLPTDLPAKGQPSPYGAPAYAPSPAYGLPTYGQPQAYPVYGPMPYGPMPYGPPASGPSYFGPTPLSLQLQHLNAGMMFDQRQLPGMPHQMFQPEPQTCGQIGCPNCRTASKNCAGTAMIADSPAPTLKLRPGEAAQVILELIDQVGPSVLDGTLYAQPIADGDLTCMARPRGATQGTPREALVQWIRRAEAERDKQRVEADVAVETIAPTQEPQVDARQANLVDTLRTVGEELDDAANLLERQSLFFRADQLRELATQLRQESRSAQGGWSLQPLRSPSVERPPHPERDLKLEVEMLQQELRAALKALDRKNEEPRR